MRIEPCPICGSAHAVDRPHDAMSPQYQFAFHTEHGRLPSWNDAMAHCPEEVQAAWGDWLKQLYGIDPSQPADMAWRRGREGT